MKLSPIQVEDALAQSVGATAPNQGPIESCIRAALKLFGPDGENWIKGAARKVLEPGQVRIYPIFEPISAFNPNDIPVQTMRCEERVTPTRYGYCSTGALVQASRPTGEDLRGIPEGVSRVFIEANRMRNTDAIVQVNDLPGTSFWIVRKMFENAISYAHERAL